jgi:hypothetical protein
MWYSRHEFTLETMAMGGDNIPKRTPGNSVNGPGFDVAFGIGNLKLLCAGCQEMNQIAPLKFPMLLYHIESVGATVKPHKVPRCTKNASIDCFAAGQLTVLQQEKKSHFIVGILLPNQ